MDINGFSKTKEYKLTISSFFFLGGARLLFGAEPELWYLSVLQFFAGFISLYIGSCYFLKVFPPTKKEIP